MTTRISGKEAYGALCWRIAQTLLFEAYLTIELAYWQTDWNSEYLTEYSAPVSITGHRMGYI